MREHLGRAVRLATEQGRPAARCEALAGLALEAATLGAERADEELLALAEQSAKDAKELMGVLPGHPPWGAEADAALAQVALARGERESPPRPRGRPSRRSALRTSRTCSSESSCAASGATLETGTEEEREIVQHRLTLTAALIAQRITDESVRVRWFRGPLGRELSRLTGRSHGDGVLDEAMGVPEAADLGEDDTRLLWLLIEGKTNREIASNLQVSEDVVARRLVEMYAKIGVSSRGEAAVLAFRKEMV